MDKKSVIEIIIKAIAKELKKLFPKAKIYDEEIEQGFKEPCFFIIYENDDERKMLGSRYKIDIDFRLIYLQELKETDSNYKIYSVRDKLRNELYTVEYEGAYFRLKEKHFEKQNKDLHLTFTISHEYILGEQTPTLEKIENLTEERKD